MPADPSTGPLLPGQGRPTGVARQTWPAVMRRLALLAAAVPLAAVLAPSAAQARPGDPVRRGGTTVEVAAGLPAFAGRVAPLGDAARRGMSSVWRPGCPVGLGDLRAVDARFVGFDGRAHRGTLVVHRAHAGSALAVLRELYAARFPMRRMHPIERYGGSDTRSIDADNTSAFNCRRVTGGTGWSEHAYGRAIDLNPIENPYVLNGRTSHAASRPFLDRRRVRPGMATEGSVVVRSFDRHGWRWGGRWTSPVDLQHFSTTGR